MINSYERIIHYGNYEARYSPEDFVNPQWFQPRDKNAKAFVLLNGGIVTAIVFAVDNLQEALDAAVNADKLDAFLVTPEELKDYETGERTDVGSEYAPDGYPVYEGITHLGNASEPFDIEALDVWEVPATTFEEDPALMTPDRVLDRLEDFADSPEWSKRYQRVMDVEDAYTLARLQIAR